MAGDCPGKTRIEDVDVFIHEPNDSDGTTRIHIDLEHPVLANIVDDGTFCGSKPAGAFIGLKESQAATARQAAEQLRTDGTQDQ